MEHGIRMMNVAQLHNALARAIGLDAHCTMKAIRRELDRRAGRRSRVA